MVALPKDLNIPKVLIEDVRNNTASKTVESIAYGDSIYSPDSDCDERWKWEIRLVNINGTSLYLVAEPIVQGAGRFHFSFFVLNHPDFDKDERQCRDYFLQKWEINLTKSKGDFLDRCPDTLSMRLEIEVDAVPSPPPEKDTHINVSTPPSNLSLPPSLAVTTINKKRSSHSSFISRIRSSPTKENKWNNKARWFGLENGGDHHSHHQYDHHRIIKKKTIHRDEPTHHQRRNGGHPSHAMRSDFRNRTPPVSSKGSGKMSLRQVTMGSNRRRTGRRISRPRSIGSHSSHLPRRLPPPPRETSSVPKSFQSRRWDSPPARLSKWRKEKPPFRPLLGPSPVYNSGRRRTEEDVLESWGTFRLPISPRRRFFSSPPNNSLNPNALPFGPHTLEMKGSPLHRPKAGGGLNPDAPEFEPGRACGFSQMDDVNPRASKLLMDWCNTGILPNKSEPLHLLLEAADKLKVHDLLLKCLDRIRKEHSPRVIASHIDVLRKLEQHQPEVDKTLKMLTETLEHNAIKA